MPNIGRPREENPYKDIRMANSAKKEASRAKKKEEVGRKLNNMAGVKKEDIFKSHEEHTQLDKNGFLKLLSHQLQNQNPMKPMDQKKFAADLAQFSQLEKMTNMNNSIEKLTKEYGGENKFYGASFLGKEVYTKDSTVNHEMGTNTKIPFHLDKPAKKVLVRIYDEKNQMVGRMMKDGMSKGQHRIEWDGTAIDDTDAASGKYTAKVWAWDNQMQKFQGDTQASGKVTGVRFKKGETVLVIDGSKEVFLRDVDKFNLPNEGGSGNSAPTQERLQEQLPGQVKAGSQAQGQGGGGQRELSEQQMQQLKQRAAAKMPGLKNQAQNAYDRREAR